MDVPYTVLARKYRPQGFAEVVGQERIAQTLRNAILEGRVAHAYLFTGARGVGKTSMARIFAKALNCPNATDGIPCNQCEICSGIAAGQDVDVSEIDGASNRGIDDIRDLRANVAVKSMRSQYKIYIIDEVHMLTTPAFNALLKTLEEPPPRVKFIFCTTDPGEVPITILSRCQRFDFGTIKTESISQRLGQLAAAEGFVVDQAALDLVARRAAGSMRDSQSLFDQLLAFGSKHLTADDVHRLLGTAPDDRLVGLVEALIVRDRAEALRRLDAALGEGVQLEAVTDQLIGYLRDLMVLGAGATETSLMSVGPDQRSTLVEQAQRWGLQTIVAAMQILAETKTRMQHATFGRALVDLALVRMSLLEDLDRLDDLIAGLKSGAVITSGSPSGSARVSAPPTPGSQTGGNRLPSPNPVGQGEKKNDLTSPPVSIGPRSATEATAAQGIETKEIPRETDLAGSPPPQEDTQSIFPNEVASTRPRPPFDSELESGSAQSVTEEPIPSVQDLLDARSAPSHIIEWKPGNEKNLRDAILSRFTDMIGASLQRATDIAIVGPNRLEFVFPANYDYGRQTCDRPEVVARIERVVEELVGKPVKIGFRVAVGEQPAASAATVPPSNSGAKTRSVEAPDDPYVQNVMDLFGVKAWKESVIPPEIQASDE